MGHIVQYPWYECLNPVRSTPKNYSSTVRLMTPTPFPSDKKGLAQQLLLLYEQHCILVGLKSNLLFLKPFFDVKNVKNMSTNCES